MAEQKRRNAGAEPISRHPLFPAIVALWVGALFGLGSIIVSPSVIERLVLAAGIDRVIPMAAPPLGTTTRILLALAATGLGALVGFASARRIARPVAIEPRRDVPEPGESVDFAPLDDPEDAAPTPGRIAGRRRALALDTGDELAAYDRAPIPGHDAPSHDPQILNVAEFDLDGFDEPEPARPVFRPHVPATEIADAEADAALPAWLDAESAWHEPAPTWADTESEWAKREDIESDFETSDADPEPFTPRGAQVFHKVFQAQLAQDAAAEPAPGFKLLPRLHAAQPVEAEAHEPVLTAPAAALDLEIGDEMDAPAVPALADVPENAIAEEPAEPVLEPRPSRHIAEADLDDLSPVELLERLALAMAERRERTRLAAEAVAHEAEVAAQVIADAARAPVTVEFAPLREVPPSPAPSAPMFERLAPAPFAAPAPFVVPVIDSELDAKDTLATLTRESDSGNEPASEASFVPAGLRPVAFDDQAGDEPLPGYVPPRHIGLTSVDTSSEFTPFPASPFAQDEVEAEEDAALTQGYSSLLNLSRHAAPHRNFARAIQFEHEEDAGIHEPATDVLGQPPHDAVPFGRPALAPAPTPQPLPAAPSRMFDAPGGGEAPDQDATERALRAALATLQRMSGAA